MYGDAGYKGIAKRPEMAGSAAEFRVAMRPGKRLALPDNPDERLQDLIEDAKAHVSAKVEHPFRVMKKQFGFQKTRLRGLAKNSWKINVIAALTNLLVARQQCEQGNGVPRHLNSGSNTSQTTLKMGHRETRR